MIFFSSAIRADNDIQWQPAFRMYRGMFLFVLEFFFFGINLYGWKSVGINPAHICDLKNSLCPLRMLEVRFVRCTREFSKPPSPPPSMTPFWSPADSKQTLSEIVTVLYRDEVRIKMVAKRGGGGSRFCFMHTFLVKNSRVSGTLSRTSHFTSFKGKTSNLSLPYLSVKFSCQILILGLVMRHSQTLCLPLLKLKSIWMNEGLSRLTIYCILDCFHQYQNILLFWSFLHQRRNFAKRWTQR